MRRIFLLVLVCLVALAAAPAVAQNIIVTGINYGAGNVVVESSGSAAPTGSCIGLARYTQTTGANNTAIWQCVGGAWYQQGTVGSGGTVTSVTFGSLSPLFTTSNTGSAAAPVLSFTLSNTSAAGQFLAGPTAAGGAPTYRAIVAGDLPSSITSNTSGNASTATTAAGYTGSAHGLSTPLACAAASGSSTAYTCSTSPSFTPAVGDLILFKPDISNAYGSSVTLAVNGGSAVNLFDVSGSYPQISEFFGAQWYLLVYQSSGWRLVSAPGVLQTTGGGTGTTSPPAAAQIPIGQGGNSSPYQPETLSGDCGVTAAGAITCNPVSAQAPTYTTCSTTCAVNLATGRTQIILLTGSPSALTISNGTAGDYTFVIVQNSTGGYTFTWPTGTRGGGVISSAAGTAAASTVAIQNFVYVPSGAITTAALVAAGPMTFGN